MHLQPGFGFGGIFAESVLPALRGEVRAELLPPASDDEKWLRRAMTVAMKGCGIASPNPTVGCVVVKDGKEIAAAVTQRYGLLHAERQALSAAKDPSGSTVYVTLEPCAHQGRQAPCVDALLEANVKRCVAATFDPFHAVAGKGKAALEAGEVAFDFGPLTAEARAWHFPFMWQAVSGRVTVAAKWAQTLDGHMADEAGHSQWLSGEASRSYTHFLRQKYDAILVGAGTVLADVPSLSVRDVADVNRQPVKVIFDPNARLLASESNVWETILKKTFSDGAPTVYGVTREALDAGDKARHKALASRGHVLLLKGSDPLSDLLESLKDVPVFATPLQSILVEGGPQLLSLLWERGALDLCHVFVVPAIMGGARHRIGKSSPSKILPFSMAAMPRLKLMSSAVLGNDVLMELVPWDRFEKVFQF